MTLPTKAQWLFGDGDGKKIPVPSLARFEEGKMANWQPEKHKMGGVYAIPCMGIQDHGAL